MNNIQAIKDCIELTQRYPLQTCLVQCQLLCNALDDSEAFNRLMDSRRRNGCLREIARLSIAKYGARNLLSALLYLAGDTDGHQLQLKVYKYDSEKTIEELRNLMD